MKKLLILAALLPFLILVGCGNSGGGGGGGGYMSRVHGHETAVITQVTLSSQNLI